MHLSVRTLLVYIKRRFRTKLFKLGLILKIVRSGSRNAGTAGGGGAMDGPY